MPHLRVVTANAASGRRPDGTHDHAAWATDAARLGAELDVDVWAVQEVDHLLPRSGARDQTADLTARLAADGSPWQGRFGAAILGTPGSRDTFRPAPRTDPDEASYGVALVTRLPVLAWYELRLEPSSLQLPVPLPPGAPQRVLWVPDEQRVALAAVLETEVGEVTVASTHLSFAPLRAGRQLRELLTWADVLPRPLVVAGDLNLPAAVVARLCALAPAPGGATYPSAEPRVRLDHLLLDPGHTRARFDASDTHQVGASDHRAACATVALVP